MIRDVERFDQPGDQRFDRIRSDDANHYSISHIEARLGPYPILGIGNAPLDRAVAYACGDADWTGQAAAELARRRTLSFPIAVEDADDYCDDGSMLEDAEDEPKTQPSPRRALVGSHQLA